MNHLNEEQLNDLADGMASTESQQHLAVCALCREELEQILQIVAAVQSLPQGVTPARDLLSGINQRIDAIAEPALPRQAPQQWRARTLWSARWPLAAAAVLLIVATAVLTRALSDRTGRPAVMASTSESSSVLVSQQTRAVTQKYEQAITELEQLLQSQRSKLAPATVQLLEENLRVIDRAIRESQEALQKDPNSELINEWLRSAYERKLELLRRATTFAVT